MKTAQGDLDASLAPERGAYRLEAYLPARPGRQAVPWLVSNPIYVGLESPSPVILVQQPPLSRIPARLTEAAAEFGRGDASVVAFSDPRLGTRAGEPPAAWTFALSAGTAHGQFAALQVPITGGLAPFDRVRFTVMSDRPMRVWTQLRATVGTTERWGRTFYTDEQERIVDLRLEDFQPIGAIAAAKPPLDQVDSLLFVVDTLNTLPGRQGTITISDVAFIR